MLIITFDFSKHLKPKDLMSNTRYIFNMCRRPAFVSKQKGAEQVYQILSKVDKNIQHVKLQILRIPVLLINTTVSFAEWVGRGGKDSFTNDNSNTWYIITYSKYSFIQRDVNAKKSSILSHNI